MTTNYDGLQYPIKITQGDDWTYSEKFSTRVNGVKTPIDLTSATVVGVVRPTYSTGTVVPMTVTINNAAQGQVTFQLSDTQTSSLPAGSLVYQMTYTIAGITKTIGSGNFIVRPKVQTA